MFIGKLKMGSETLIVRVVGYNGAMTVAVVHKVRKVTENWMKFEAVP